MTVTVTSVVESESITSPRFLFADARQGRRRRGRRRPPAGCAPHFVDEQGYLLQKIQALVIDTGSTTIVVDTCVGNDKVRQHPGWNALQLPFLEDLAAAGYPPEDGRRRASAPTSTSTTWAGTPSWSTVPWVPTFPNARYLFAQPEYDHWRAEAVPRRRRVLGDSVDRSSTPAWPTSSRSTTRSAPRSASNPPTATPRGTCRS